MRGGQPAGPGPPPFLSQRACRVTPFFSSACEAQELGLPGWPAASALAALEVGGETPRWEPSLWLQRRIRP